MSMAVEGISEGEELKERENRIRAPCTKSVTEDNRHNNPRELGPFLDCNLNRLLYGFSKLALRDLVTTILTKRPLKSNHYCAFQ